jgi:hypothetical protein
LASQTFHDLPKVAGEQIVLVLIVRVKRRAAHVGPMANVLHGNGLVALFLNQDDERLRQCLARPLRASIGQGVVRQMRHFVHLQTFPGD